jgi:hypothetical protein
VTDNSKDYKLKVKLDLSQLQEDIKVIPKKLAKAQAKIGTMLDMEIKQRQLINRLIKKQTKLIDKQRGALGARGRGTGATARGGTSARATTPELEAARQQQLLDKENYRIWQLRQDGERRRAKERERELKREAQLARQARAARGPVKARETFGADLEYQQSRLRRMTPTSDAERATIGSLMQESQRIQQQAAGAQTAGQLRRLRNEYSEINKQISQVTAQQRRFNRELERANQRGNMVAKTMGRLALQLGSVYAVMRAGRAVFRIGTEMDQMQAALLAASDTAEDAQKNFQFLRETSLELGKDIQTMTGGFNRIGVAMQAAGFEGEAIKEVFLAAAESATAFGLSNQRTEMTLLAMSQIVSYRVAPIYGNVYSKLT